MKHPTNNGQSGQKAATQQSAGNGPTKKASAAMKTQRKQPQASFFNFMERAIERLRRLNRSATAKNYTSALHSFRLFKQNTDIGIEAIDHLLIEDYQSFLASTGITPNSTSFYMRILRAVYNRAVNGLHLTDRKPFRTVFTGTEKTLKRAVSSDYIRLLIELGLPRAHRLELARDLFLFLFLGRGMSFIDAAFLKKTDIRNGVLTYRRHKTGRMLYIKVTMQMKDIIDRHTDKDSPYLLPVITRPGTDERRQYETALRNLNKSLKTIAGMIKQPVTLTTYVSRHAWATIAKSKNIPIHVISEALGHESVVTTQIYLDSIDAAVIDDANEMIIQDLYKK